MDIQQKEKKNNFFFLSWRNNKVDMTNNNYDLHRERERERERAESESPTRWEEPPTTPAIN